MKYVLGITGGIGSGKSYVSDLFTKNHGIPVYDSDTAAKNAINNNEELRDKIKQLIPNAFAADGSYDRKHVAKLIFTDNDLRNSLTLLVSSYMREGFDAFCESTNSKLVCVESAVFESTWMIDVLSGILDVRAPVDMRVERVLLRDKHRTEEDVRAIIDAQRPCMDPNFVIVNDGTHVIDDDIRAIITHILS